MYDDLLTVRRLKILIRQLSEEHARLAPGISSPRMDGMPRGGKGGGVEANIDLRTTLDRRIREATQAEIQAEKRALCAMEGLPPQLHSLCAYYFLGAMSVSETVAVMGISRTSFYRYMDTLKNWNSMGQSGT